MSDIKNLIEYIVYDLLKTKHLRFGNEILWDEYDALSKKINSNYEVPQTSFSEAMKMLIFGLSNSLKPMNILGLGTYVGYGISWAIDGSNQLESATCVDIDNNAINIFNKNVSHLKNSDKIISICANVFTYLKVNDNINYDLVFIDIDDIETGKDKYVDVLDMIFSKSEEPCLFLLHDTMVPKFKTAFDKVEAFCNLNHLEYYPFEIDDCGISIVVK